MLGQSAFEIARKSATPSTGSSGTGSSGTGSSGTGSSSEEERGRQDRERQHNKRGKRKSPPQRVQVRNGMGEVQEREVQFDEDDNHNGRSGTGEDEESEDDSRRRGRGQGRARKRARREAAAEAAERAARVAGDGGGDPNGDGDPNDDDDGDDINNHNGRGGGDGPNNEDPSDPRHSSDSSDSSDPSSSPSMTSEEIMRLSPDINEDPRITSRLTSLRERYEVRRAQAQADDVEYRQGIFSTATGREYGDAVTAEDLKRDFGYLKFLVQKFVEKLPTDDRNYEELEHEFKSEMVDLTRYGRRYWGQRPGPLRKWLLEALIWRRLQKVMFDRQYSEYFAFGHGKAMLTEFWITSCKCFLVV